MNLLDILTPDCIMAPLTATDKKGVIDELVDVLAAGAKVADAKSLKEAVWTREQTRTTGIGTKSCGEDHESRVLATRAEEAYRSRLRHSLYTGSFVA